MGKRILSTKIFHSWQNRLLVSIVAVLTGINILSWNSKAFTDWYRMHVFPLWTATLGRMSNLTRGSVGELLILIGICCLLFGILLTMASLLEKRICTNTGMGQIFMRKHLRRIRALYARLLCVVLVYIYGTETLNCFVNYHTSTIEEQYYADAREYGMEELVDAYTQVATKANALSEIVERDAKGQAVYGDSTAALYEACKKAMRKQGNTYPYLAGYYPDPKPIRASRFMSQQYLLGVYFPFTMEANYNTVMYPVNVPATICHEYSHLKGTIMEDEANYFGFVACIESEEPYLQYSGYLSVIGYLARQVRMSVPEEVREGLVVANELVKRDDVFLTEEQWEKVEQKAVFSTEAVNQATNAFMEKTLTMNGISDGIQSYSRVVRLVIHYYESPVSPARAEK